MKNYGKWFRRGNQEKEHSRLLCEQDSSSRETTKKVKIDMFGGSGSTLIASDKLNRICNVMEYESKWTDVIVKRYHNLGKEDITLIRDGKEYKWEDIKTEIIK